MSADFEWVESYVRHVGAKNRELMDAVLGFCRNRLPSLQTQLFIGVKAEQAL